MSKSGSTLGCLDDVHFGNYPCPAWRMIEVNLSGSMNFIRVFVETMKLQKYGEIVLLSSAQELSGCISQANYSASKSGMFVLSKVGAKEYAPRFIQIQYVRDIWKQIQTKDNLLKKTEL